MNSIVLHPQSEQESRLYESIAQALRTPYTIQKSRSEKHRKKPSDFIGTLSESTGMKLHEYVNKSREEWNRGF